MISRSAKSTGCIAFAAIGGACLTAISALADDSHAGRDKLAEMMALVREGSDACPATPGGTEVLMLYMAAGANQQAPTEDEIVAKQAYVRQFRKNKGYVKFCQLYDVELYEAKILVDTMKGQ